MQRAQVECELLLKPDFKCLLYNGNGFLSQTMNKGRPGLTKKADQSSVTVFETPGIYRTQNPACTR